MQITVCDQKKQYVFPQIYRSILSKQECMDLMEWAKKKGLSDSFVKDYVKQSEYRKSKTCWVAPSENPIVKTLYEKISHMVDIPIQDFEEFQIVHYQKNEYFKSHYDQCTTDDAYCIQELKRFHGPRLYTFLIYLNDPSEYEKGTTHFPHLEIEFKEDQGDGVLFCNLDRSEKFIHPYSYHQGSSITRGEKWIGNVWIRKRMFV